MEAAGPPDGGCAGHHGITMGNELRRQKLQSPDGQGGIGGLVGPNQGKLEVKASPFLGVKGEPGRSIAEVNLLQVAVRVQEVNGRAQDGRALPEDAA